MTHAPTIALSRLAIKVWAQLQRHDDLNGCVDLIYVAHAFGLLDETKICVLESALDELADVGSIVWARDPQTGAVCWVVL